LKGDSDGSRSSSDGSKGSSGSESLDSTNFSLLMNSYNTRQLVPTDKYSSNLYDTTDLPWPRVVGLEDQIPLPKVGLDSGCFVFNLHVT
jgi:hypothetical protein